MNYMTVSQYASLVGKDTSVIRRLIASGAIKAEKLGNQWILPNDTVYPIDKRIKSGEYRNWRKMSDVRKSNPILMKALSQMCNELKGIYGNQILKIVLYGSYARGEETAESDVDIALILKEADSEKTHEAMTDVVVDYELEQGVTLSVITIEYENYAEWRTTLPFYKNIDREGIVLWKAAS